MLKKILIVCVLVIVGVCIFASFQPDHFKIERSLVMSAAPEKIFPYINNPRKMNEWNPWLDLDRNAKLTYEGPEEGVDAVNAWDGDKNMGAGKSTIVENKMNEYVKVRLDFLRPMESTSYGIYALHREGEQTRVSWTMEGKNTFIGRVICLFMNMDKMMGETFEKGLQTLKTIVEK